MEKLLNNSFSSFKYFMSIRESIQSDFNEPPAKKAIVEEWEKVN